MNSPYLACEALHTDGLTAPLGWYCALLNKAKTIQVELDCYNAGGELTHVSLALIHQLSTGPMPPNFSVEFPDAQTTLWTSRYKTATTRHTVYDSRDVDSGAPNGKPFERVTSQEAGLFLYNDTEHYVGDEKFVGWWETWVGNGTEVYYPSEGSPVPTEVIGANFSLPRTTAIQPWRIVEGGDIVKSNLMRIPGPALDDEITVFIKYPGYLPISGRDYLPFIIGSFQYDHYGSSSAAANVNVSFGGQSYPILNAYGGIYTTVTGTITVASMW